MSNGTLHRAARPCVGLSLLALSMACAGPADAKVFRCTDAKGSVYYQDTTCPPAPAPAAPPPPSPLCTLTLEERRRAETLEREFVNRYRTETDHRRAEWVELRDVAARLRTSLARLDELARENRRIRNELEFVGKGKPLSALLRRELDANVAQLEALKDVFANVEQSIADVVARFRCQRETLGVRWSPEAAPGASACQAACGSR